MFSLTHPDLNGPKSLRWLTALWLTAVLPCTFWSCGGGEEVPARSLAMPQSASSDPSHEPRCDHQSFSGPVVRISSDDPSQIEVYDPYAVGHVSESLSQLERSLRSYGAAGGQANSTLAWEGARDPSSIPAGLRTAAEHAGFDEFVHCPQFRYDAAARLPDVSPLNLAPRSGYGGAPARAVACGELPIPTLQIEVRSPGHRIHEDILAQVEQARDELLLCYDRKSVIAPDWASSASVSLTLDVKHSGAVSRVRVASDIDHFVTTRCLGNAAKRWNFHAAESEAPIVVELSFSRTLGRRPELCERYSSVP